MINFLTVHWKSDQWVDIQLEYLKRCINEPFRVHAFLNYLPNDHADKFFYSSTEPIQDHAEKLNLLAERICLSPESKDDDILIFLDGDAFPIQELMHFVYDKLKNYSLLAIQRQENNGDPQPHPSFCATTVGFWQEVKGDWSKGYKWKNSRGRVVTDVGGNLLKILQDNQINWYPMLRSNTSNYHPMFFGIYDNLIYHHGAGFRKKWTRIDEPDSHTPLNLLVNRFIGQLPRNQFTKPIIKRFDLLDKAIVQVKEKNEKLSEQIYEKIKSDPLFFKEFLQ